jgi:CheY-like chemotaxis protein
MEVLPVEDDPSCRSRLLLRLAPIIGHPPMGGNRNDIRIRGQRHLKTMRVLIVEDHSHSREQLERCLTQRDYDVTTAGDLRTAIDLLNTQQFDAIIADIALPDGTGYALISEVRRRGIHALSIAVSGYPYPSDVDEPGATGFHYHLSKPVDCDHICSLLKERGASEGDASAT